MKFSFSRLFVFVIASILLTAQSVSAQLVEIPDPNLRKAVRETLAMPDEIPLNQQEMLRLKRLSAWDSEITDLTGLEHATSLINLGLCINQIHDLRPLAGLVQLEGLSLCVNQITDISPLANLTNLRELDLGANGQIVDITPLANLTRLERINLGSNLIEDITPLSNLTQLTYLRLRGNQIRDISPLANLVQLEELEIERNAITDITPLIGLKNLKKLSLADNPFHDFSTLLELEGVELDLDIDLSRLDELNIVVEVPDPNLKQAIREALQLPEGILITQLVILRLTRLRATDIGITDLTGLEYAINLDTLDLGNNGIRDVRPLAGLIALSHLSLWNNQVEDITPLANLTNLVSLNLSHNNVADVSILANLTNLQSLAMRFNLATDFSPLQNLTLIRFEYDEVCDIPPQLPSVRERIESRSFPSILQAWNTGVVGLDHLTWEQRNVLHDLHWNPNFNHTIGWDVTSIEPAGGVATSLAGALGRAREIRQRRLDQNPNMVFLGGVGLQQHHTLEAFPPDSDFWLRDSQGQIIRGNIADEYRISFDEYLINFLKPEVQDLLAKRIIAIARCGLYDGIFIDGFNSNGTGFVGRHLHPSTDEEIIQAYLNIFRAVRLQVRDDFLILVNANDTKPTRFTEYVNGIFMETHKDHPGGYSRDWLMKLEETLSWAEQNLRSPTINGLEGEGMSIEPPDGPNNLRWMRLFTTLTLTHSDGYVLYTTGVRDLGPPHPHHDHLWHSFWDADLGRPINNSKAQLYQNIEGLFIREFTNGWAVYNRSGQAQTIMLPASATSVSDRGSNAASQTHILPDLDGEIYLTTRSFADVNRDGRVNVLDLVQVANGLGKATPDPNGDGVVNILDLVFVTQQFSE